jgi:putative acetyltransferase
MPDQMKSAGTTLLTIRDYTPDDLDALIELFLRSIREVACRDYTPAQIDAWAQVDRGVWSERRLSRPTWVALWEGTIAGFTDLEPDGHLDMMFIHPGYQGLGIATTLLATVEQAARHQRLTRLFTEASLTAHPFFERRGFTLIAEQQVARHGQMLTNFRMEKGW